jgi:hypothetical protein
VLASDFDPGVNAGCLAGFALDSIMGILRLCYAAATAIGR